MFPSQRLAEMAQVSHTWVPTVSTPLLQPRTLWDPWSISCLLGGCSSSSEPMNRCRFLSIGPHEVCFSGWSRLALQLNPSLFLFGFFLFLIIFLHTFQEAISALRVLNVLNTHINSLGKNLALNLFVYNNANSMLGNIVDSPSFAMVTFVGAFHFEQYPFP